MSYPVLIYGKSSSGKSTSMHDLPEYGKSVALINVLDKALPFKGGNKIPSISTDDYDKVYDAISRAKADIIVIDDAGYLMTNQFMRNHSAAGKGNGVFTLYNQIGDSFFNLIDKCRKLQGNKRIYIMMHEATDDYGITKPKSIGKMVDSLCCLEGMFTIVLRAMTVDGKHIFRTVTDGNDVAKSPMGLFEADEIPNSLATVDKAICEYYEIGE